MACAMVEWKGQMVKILLSYNFYGTIPSLENAQLNWSYSKGQNTESLGKLMIEMDPKKE